MQPVRVKEIRRLYGMTQEDFADLIGVAVGTLRDWEQGRISVPLMAKKFLERLAEDRRPELAAV